MISPRNTDHEQYPPPSEGGSPEGHQTPPLDKSSSFSRLATTANAFGLSLSPASSSSSAGNRDVGQTSGEISPPGTTARKRLRRPSMLSLMQNADHQREKLGQAVDRVPFTYPLPSADGGFHVPDDDDEPKVEAPPKPKPLPTAISPTPRWAPPGFLQASLRRTSSAPPLAFEGLTTSTPPIPHPERLESPEVLYESGTEGSPDIDAIRDDRAAGPEEGDPQMPVRWMPSHLAARRKGKARMDDEPVPPPAPRLSIPGRPLPASLLATLISESSPLEHEMRSEARLQRLIHSHPSALPFTPRPTRPNRGRFPESFEDDEDDAFRRPSWARRWRASSSESESDEGDIGGGEVNANFAAGMELDRPSSSSSATWPQENRNVTPGHAATGSRSNSGQSGAAGPAMPSGAPTPPTASGQWAPRHPRKSFSTREGAVPSPGGGLALPSAFGGLGMGGGTGTPLASPTIERMEVGRQSRPRSHAARCVSLGVPRLQSKPDAIPRLYFLCIPTAREKKRFV